MPLLCVPQQGTTSLPGAQPLGRTLATVAGPAAGLLLYVDDGGPPRSFGRLSFGDALTPAVDAALAFNPVRNAPEDLHPTGLVHASRGLAYRLSQRWRGVTPTTAMP